MTAGVFRILTMGTRVEAPKGGSVREDPSPLRVRPEEEAENFSSCLIENDVF